MSFQLLSTITGNLATKILQSSYLCDIFYVNNNNNNNNNNDCFRLIAAKYRMAELQSYLKLKILKSHTINPINTRKYNCTSH